MGKTIVSYRNDSDEIVPEELATWVCIETFNDAGERVRVENVRRERPVEWSEKELSEMKAMERFLAEAFEYSEDRIAAMTKKPGCIRWYRENEAWNYHDDSWTENRWFILQRISPEEFEKNRFSDDVIWSWYGDALKKWNPQAEYYIHNEHTIDGDWISHVEKIYLAEIPGCTGPFCIESGDSNDRS